MKDNQNYRSAARRGIAIVPVMLVVSGLAIFTMALVTATMSGARSNNVQSEDYHLASAVESVSVLAMDQIWRDFEAYVDAGANRDLTITDFRTFMNTEEMFDEAGTFDTDGDGVVETIPGPEDGTDLMPLLDLPQRGGNTQFNDVNIDAVQMVRIDLPGAGGFPTDVTQLFITVSASTTRAAGIVNPIMNRAVQQVYTVEPDAFDGFEYAMLANNVNCIFCHTKVDTVDRFFNTDDEAYGSFEKARVGTLESLLIRHDMDGNSTVYNNYDADSFVAGSVYTRGTVAQHDGAAITDWSDLSFLSYEFVDGTSLIYEDSWGDMTTTAFSPAGATPEQHENLYLNYDVNISDQVDGPLPSYFPAPIPDDGGVDPATKLPDPNAINNRMIDDVEFDHTAATATGAITAGHINVTGDGDQISTLMDYGLAALGGNTTDTGIQQRVEGNVILTGSYVNPIRIDGTVAIDGDLVISGWVQGEGTLLVRGNVYVPSDLVYLDELDGNGNRNFGSNNGLSNALGLTAGGNIIIGDFQRPASLQPDGTYDIAGQYEITSGNPDTGDPMVDEWSFALSEVALFNRGEWARTQEFLPGIGEDFNSPTVPNPHYDPNYIPRYYSYGDDTTIPIFNHAPLSAPDPLQPDVPFLYYDPALDSWIGEEGVIGWETDLLTYADPTDPSDPLLFDAGSGDPIAVTSALTHQGDWITPEVYQQAVEYMHANRGDLDYMPLQIDALLYTNNAIFSIVHKDTNFLGRMVLNGSLIAADLGILVPGHHNLPAGFEPNRSPLSDFAIGLQLNYDKRVKELLNVTNPNRVQLKRTLWNPTANLMQ